VSVKSLRFAWVAVLVVTCLACAAPLPEHDPNMAWIDIQARAGHQLSAQRLDGRRVDDARYVQVSPGAHQLQVRLIYNRGSSRTGESQRRCLIDIVYPEFVAGERYRIQGVAQGWMVRAWLYGSDGQRIVESLPVRCGSQY